MKRYDTYKDSGVQWLGEIPGHWGCVPIRRIAYVNPTRTKNLDIDSYVGYAPMERIRCDNMNPSKIKVSKLTSGLTYCEEGDIVLAKVTPCFENGNLAIVPQVEQGCCYASSELFVFRAKGKVMPRFLLYTFLNRGFINAGASTMRGTGGLKRVTTEFANSAATPLPPLSEQHSIVSYLDDKCGKIDEWVTKKQKEVEHLQELKQRVIADAVTRGLNPHVKMKATNIPWLKEIPEHWEVLRNKSILRLTDEKVGNRNDLNLLSLTKQGVIIRDLSEGKGKFPKDFETYLVVRPNNLVFCLFDIDETPRTVGLVRNYGMLTGAYTNFEVNEDIVLPEYVYCYYLQIDDVKGLRPYYTGLRKVVKTNTFLQLRMPVPPLSEQRSIVSYLDAKCAKIDKLITNITKEIECIKEYKQRLISDVVKGQIKVC